MEVGSGVDDGVGDRVGVGRADAEAVDDSFGDAVGILGTDGEGDGGGAGVDVAAGSGTGADVHADKTMTSAEPTIPRQIATVAFHRGRSCPVLQRYRPNAFLHRPLGAVRKGCCFGNRRAVLRLRATIA